MVNFLSVISQQGRSKPLSQEQAADLCRMQCLTVAFLLHMPLSQRAQIRIMKSCWTKQVLPLIKMVCIALSYFPCHQVQLLFQFSFSFICYFSHLMRSKNVMYLLQTNLLVHESCEPQVSGARRRFGAIISILDLFLDFSS